MFPSSSIRRIAESLLEVAEAALRPVDAVHPHERAAAVRLQRRPGTVPSRPHACAAPIARRADAAPAIARTQP